MIYASIPYRSDKNLFHAYDEHFKILNDEDWLIINDMDTLFLTYDWFDRIQEATEIEDAGIITAFTNRVACTWQVADGRPSGDLITEHREFANNFTFPKGWVIDRTHEDFPLSGFLMVIQKNHWEKMKPFITTREGCLGLDNELHMLTRDLKKRVYQVPVYMYHWYRGGSKDKSHLL